MIVGLSGWAGSGKDTIADLMVKELGFTKIAFADPLRNFLLAQDPEVRMDGQPVWVPLGIIIEKYGWNGYKQSPFANGVRKLIQKTGTEAGRGVLGETVWIDAAVKMAEGIENVVFSDARFINEAKAVEWLGGEVVRIEREGVGPANDHASEMEMNDYPFKFHLINNGTPQEALESMKAILGLPRN